MPLQLPLTIKKWPAIFDSVWLYCLTSGAPMPRCARCRRRVLEPLLALGAAHGAAGGPAVQGPGQLAAAQGEPAALRALHL